MSFEKRLHPSLATPRRDLASRLVVWTVWAGMTLATLWLVASYGFHLPFIDDYTYIVPIITDYPGLTTEPVPLRRPGVTLGWLWEQYGPNRIPLGKLVHVASLAVTNGSFLAGALGNTVILSVCAFALICVARRIRGYTALSDAIFPLVLLGWGNYETLAWSMILPWVLGVPILLSVLFLILQSAPRRPVRSAVLAGLLVPLLTVCGPSNLAYVPILTVWLGIVAYWLWSDALQRRRSAVVVGVLALAALGLVGLYFLGFKSEPETAAKEPAAILRGALEALSMSLTCGEPAILELSAGGLQLWHLTYGAMTILFVTSAALLVRVWVNQPAERLRAGGLLLFLGGTAGMLLALGWARAGAGSLLMQPRYSLFAMPPLFALYFTWVLYGPTWTRWLVPISLLAAVGALAPLNFLYGFQATQGVRSSLDQLAKHVEAGFPSYIVAELNYEDVFLPDLQNDDGLKEYLTRCFRALREKGIPPFAEMAEDPPAAEVALKVPKLSYTAEGKPYLLCKLPRPLLVYAVRLRYDLATEEGQSGVCQAYWKESGKNEFRADERNFQVRLRPTDAELEAVNKLAHVWVNDTLDQLRIQPPEAAAAFRLNEIVLLVPPRGSP